MMILHGKTDNGEQIASLTASLNAANASLATVTSERDTLIAERDALIVERDALNVSIANANASLSTMTAERDALIVERDALNVQIATANASIATITAERDSLISERDGLIAQLATANASLATITAERDALIIERDELLTRALSDEFYESLRDIMIDGRYLPNGLPAEDSAILEAKTIATRFLYARTYRYKFDRTVPEFIQKRRYSYHLQPDMTGATTLPDIPAGATDVDYIYIYQRISAANSLGGAGVIDVPTTWRNATGCFRIVLERTELTSAQQVTIIQGIEREILAGLGSAYTSTSTTTRIIDFQSTSSGANDALVQADLVALGWNIVSSTQMDKTINGFRWRVLHNA